jgi:hypothetical protein
MMANMRPTLGQGKKAAIAKLLKLRQQAQRDKEPRMLLRIQGILMSLDGQTTGAIAEHLIIKCIAAPFHCGSINGTGTARKAY